jgi:hypothetical protein
MIQHVHWPRAMAVTLIVFLTVIQAPRSFAATDAPSVSKTIGVMQGFMPVATPTGPSFIYDTYPALYHLRNGRWVRTRIIHLGEAAQFVLRFRTLSPGWQKPSAHLRITRTWIGGQHHTLQFGWRHIYRIGMRRQVLPGGITRFSITAVFKSRKMLGGLRALFHVTNGVGAVEPGLLFTVTP